MYSCTRIENTKYKKQMKKNRLKYLQYSFVLELLLASTLVSAQGGSGGAGGVGMGLVYMGVFVSTLAFLFLFTLIAIYSNINVLSKSDRTLIIGIIAAILLFLLSLSITVVFFLNVEGAPTLFWAGTLMFLAFMLSFSLSGRLVYYLGERRKKQTNDEL